VFAVLVPFGNLPASLVLENICLPPEKALPLDIPLGNNIWAIPLNEEVKMLGYVYRKIYWG